MATIFGINNSQAEFIEENAEGLYVYLDRNEVSDRRDDKMP